MNEDGASRFTNTAWGTSGYNELIEGEDPHGDKAAFFPDKGVLLRFVADPGSDGEHFRVLFNPLAELKEENAVYALSGDSLVATLSLENGLSLTEEVTLELDGLRTILLHTATFSDGFVARYLSYAYP